METQINTIYQIDCIEGLKKLPDNFVDSIVTDPPYELGFMGKQWDKTGIAYNIELWKECLRVLKPGGHLLAFGGTRTYHRMACAIEDARFEIRDCIMWIYGQGFSKGQDISKAIDKLFGAEREVIGIDKYRTKRIPHGRNKNNEGWNYGVDKRAGEDFKITIPATPEAQQWQGWGTALKPAYEPIVVARKPLNEKNVALNVLQWGTGGINVDACRIPINPEIDDPRLGGKGTWKTCKMAKNVYNGGYTGDVIRSSSLGRYPANVILDEEAAKMLDEQSGILKSRTNCKRTKAGSFLEHGGLGKPGDIQITYGDSGGASRFFYCAKASSKERWFYCIECKDVFPVEEYEQHNHSPNCRITHPTVKPLKLIEYLVKLVTPPNGICLDPFEGSGTHALACIKLGFNYIGFEINPDYYEISQRRITEYSNKGDNDARTQSNL